MTDTVRSAKPVSMPSKCTITVILQCPYGEFHEDRVRTDIRMLFPRLSRTCSNTCGYITVLQWTQISPASSISGFRLKPELTIPEPLVYNSRTFQDLYEPCQEFRCNLRRPIINQRSTSKCKNTRVYIYIHTTLKSFDVKWSFKRIR